MKRLLGLLLVAASAGAAELRAVPTFENCSLYLEGFSISPELLKIRYREPGAAAWLEGHPFVDSENDRAPRGSLFGLRAATAYEVECADAAGTPIARAAFTTWSEMVPIARTVKISELAPGGGPVLIDQGGTAAGWVRYIGDAPVAGGERDAEAVLVQAPFVILEGITVRGGKRHGIRVGRTDHVRISNCDIAGFGRVGTQDLGKDGKYYDGQGKEINYDAGVCIDEAADTVVERCFVHDPRSRANSWFFSHPAGPTAMFVRSRGGLVVRWNDFAGSDGHRWNDVIEGYGNGKPDGGFNHDADIHGNYLACGNDDSIELDGPQCNVRFYGNLLTGSMCGISTAPNLRGPSWIYANAVVALSDERGLGSAGVKNGGGSSSSKGRSFFYHNTFYTAGSGVSAVGYGSDKDRGRFLAVSRNNIFALTGSGVNDPFLSPGNSFDHDLFSLPWAAPGSMDVGRAQEPDSAKGVEEHGVFQPAALTDPGAGDFRPAAASPARGMGQRLPGFAWLQTGAMVDAGAFQAGGRPLPWRPCDLRATPSFLEFRGPVAKAAPITVVIEAGNLPAPRHFSVVRTEASDWMSVEPAQGTLAPGGRVELAVSLVRERIMARGGAGRGSLVFRLDGGDSVPLTVGAEVSGADLWIAAEAEALAGADGFKAVEDAGASGGRYLDFQSADGKKEIGSLAVTLPVEVPEDGAYTLCFRVRCPLPVATHDSFFVAIDDAEPVQCPVAGGAAWAWVNMTTRTGSRISLAKGAHRLRILPRESLDLDAVMLRSGPLPLDQRGEAMPR